jgi:hypothetical protein
MATLQEVVQSHEQGVRGQLPLVLSLTFVLKVSILELGAHINSDLKLL